MKGSSQGSSSTGRRVYVLDAAGIFAGLPLQAPGPFYTTPSVVEEVKDENSRRILERSATLGRLKVRSPSQGFMEEARRVASELGVEVSLSHTDVEVLALALELRASSLDVVVVTDDYMLQNASTYAGLRFMSVKTLGIRGVRRYEVYCPACGYKPSEPVSESCPRCGHSLARRPKA